MKNGKLLILCIIVGAIIAGIDCILSLGHSATIILTMAFWTSIIEGCIALVAAVEATGSDWIKPVKKYLLALHPLILFLAVMFAFMYTKLDYYPWHDMNGKWLNKEFFMIRNIAMFLITFLVARKYAIESLKESDNKMTYSILYLFCWVTSISLVAFDWVMSLEYPWVSTLFGAYYFTESLQLGMGATSIVIFVLCKRYPDKFKTYQKTLKDIGILLLGWSVVWVGFMFAQLLTIWYGHLPEESSFFIMRVEMPYYKYLMFLVIFLTFVIPFASLIFNRSKRSPFAMSIIACVIFAGNMLERLIILKPLIPINFFLLLIEFIGMAILFITALDLNNPQQ